VKEEEWAVTKSPTISASYNLEDEAAPPLIATLDYKGPKGNNFVPCNDPVFTVTDENDVAISFLEAQYDSDTEEIYLFVKDGVTPDKGTYALHISFT